MSGRSLNCNSAAQNFSRTFSISRRMTAAAMSRLLGPIDYESAIQIAYYENNKIEQNVIA